MQEANVALVYAGSYTIYGQLFENSGTRVTLEGWSFNRGDRTSGAEAARRAFDTRLSEQMEGAQFFQGGPITTQVPALKVDIMFIRPMRSEEQAYFAKVRLSRN